jgi:hypothetical protein
MPEVFINYRTGDGEKTAVVIEKELVGRFGEDRIFRASTSIRPGESYPERLLGAVHESKVMLAVVGAGWSGVPALRNADDWVRREILEALTCGIPVIPILDGRKTDRLNAADLPAELARLAERQSIPLDLNDGGDGLRRIGDELAKLIPALRKADRAVAREPAAVDNSVENTVENTVREMEGTAVQTQNFKGVVGHVVKNPTGPVHLGKGDINQGTRNYYGDSAHTRNYYGDGVTEISGGNKGGVKHRFGRRADNRDGDRTPESKDDDR